MSIVANPRMRRAIWIASVLSLSAGCTLDDPDDLGLVSQNIEMDSDGGGGGGGGGGGPVIVPSIFRSSLGTGGTGAIRDLKFEKGDSSNQSPLPGYTLIPLDLNKGAAGKYIYLTFTRDEQSVQHYGPSGCLSGPFVTMIYAEDVPWYDTTTVKAVCLNGDHLPIGAATGISVFPWNHPDLNDGSGGRFIYGWQLKRPTDPPMTEVGVVAGDSSAITCPAGWTRSNQDLNEGAGGDYIYFCHKL